VIFDYDSDESQRFVVAHHELRLRPHYTTW